MGKFSNHLLSAGVPPKTFCTNSYIERLACQKEIDKAFLFLPIQTPFDKVHHIIKSGGVFDER